MNNELPRILVIPAWYNISKPSVGSFFHDFCNAFDESCNITVLDVNLYSYSDRKHKIEKEDFLTDRKYGLLRMNYYNSIPGAWLGLNFKIQRNNMCRQALKLVSDYECEYGKFDLVHIQSACNNVTPILAKKIADDRNIPLVVTEHYTGFSKNSDHLFEPFTSSREVCEIVKGASLRFGVSSNACKIFSKYFECEFQVQPNLINSIFEAELPEQMSRDDFCLKFLCIGSLIERKGQLKLIKSFANLQVDFPNIEIQFIGEGSDRDMLLAYIKNNQIENVSISSWKNKSEIIKEIDNSDVIVSASTLETFGLTIVEGFFRGKPVVTTNSGGPKDFVNSSNGVLVEDINVSGLQEGLKEMILNYPNYSPSNIRKEAIDKYSEKAIAIQMMVHYNSVLKNS